MENFNDSHSIANQFISELDFLDFKFIVSTKYWKDKTYNSKADKIYYSVGDHYQRKRANKNFEIDSTIASSLKKIGFIDLSSDIDRVQSRTSYVRKTFLKGVESIIGVEPNGLEYIAKSNQRFDVYDSYDYYSSHSVLCDFNIHCEKRWGFKLSTELVECLWKVEQSWGGYEDMFKEVKLLTIGNSLTTGRSFMSRVSAFNNYSVITDPLDVEKQRIVKNSGIRIINAPLSKAPENGRMKNEMATRGLLYAHDYYVLIGDSPGTHYRKYAGLITPSNSISYDPRELDYAEFTTHKKQMFTNDDIPDLLNIIKDQTVLGNKVLIRIDIRSDKPAGYDGGYNEEWERMVHLDNVLTADIINAVHDDVTVVAKVRPSFSVEYEAPRLNKRFKICPLPYLTVSTAEFTLFVPRVSLKKKNLWGTEHYTYFKLQRMAERVCVLKRVCGKLYNTYLCDMYLNFGVICDSVGLMDNSLALFSLSNSVNDKPSVLLSKAVSNFIVTFPYTRVGVETMSITTNNRSYTDNSIDFIYECCDESVPLVPIYSLPLAGHITRQDLTNVLLSDKDLISYTQPDNQMSTQMVKLVSFILKQLCSIRGIDFTALDDRVRHITIESYLKRLPVNLVNIQYVNDSKTNFIIGDNDLKISVSGHMQYILIGSIFGLPYGIKRYLKEIEHNIIRPGDSYERNVGSRVWHGFLSHYLAVNSCNILLHELCILDEMTSNNIRKALNWVIAELLKLASKHSIYLQVDERDNI